MPGRLRVVTLVGTRPEIIKLCRVIAELDRHTDHVLVHSGQNYDYELNEIFFSDLEVRKPDHFLGAAGGTAAETIGNVIAGIDRILEETQPDAFVLLGDTNSCLGAIAAKRRHVPIFHMEAGNRSFDFRVPEETNRRIVDHISDINMTYTEHARRYLLAEGLRPDTVMKTGSPMREVLHHYADRIDASDVLQRLDLEHRGYFVVSAHREENVDREPQLRALLDTLDGLVEVHGKPVIFSTHPRTRARLEALEDHTPNPAVRFLKPLGLFDYVHLQQHAACVVSDSGTITEESTLLDFPAVTIRQAHERPEGMDCGTVIMCGLRRDRVLDAIDTVIEHFDEDGRSFQVVPDYEPLDVSRKVVRIIKSYVDFVRRTVYYEG
jgi:UDP-N-acetylglucosamine 2-epimerase (non-hydrolysing)